MPAVIDAQATSNDYSAACTIVEVFKSNGGYFTVSAADVFMQMQYGDKGLFNFTTEVHVPIGSAQLYPGTTGIRFRSYKTGTPATVSAALYYNAEPAFALSSQGSVTLAAGSVITGIVSPTGVIVGGTGFSVVHSGLGTYTVTFTTAFSTTPVVLLTGQNANETFLTALGAGSFGVATNAPAGAPADTGFVFTATPTV